MRFFHVFISLFKHVPTVEEDTTGKAEEVTRLTNTIARQSEEIKDVLRDRSIAEIIAESTGGRRR